MSKPPPLEAAYAVLPENSLDGAGEALRILVNEAAKIERSQFLGAGLYERSANRRDYANGFKPKTVLTRVRELTFQVPSFWMRVTRKCGWKAESSIAPS